MKKIRNRKGFTLAELLVVIAIISILIAIAIPTFSSQLEKARLTVDAANARAASSLAYSDYMLYHADLDGTVTYTFGTDQEGNLFILTHQPKDGEPFPDNSAPADGTQITAKSDVLGETQLTVVIEDGRITENTWLSAIADAA